jgi:hypothetical protein
MGVAVDQGGGDEAAFEVGFPGFVVACRQVGHRPDPRDAVAFQDDAGKTLDGHPRPRQPRVC